MKKLLLAITSLFIVSNSSGADLLKRVEAEYKLNGLAVSAFESHYSLDCDVKITKADNGVRIYLKVSGVKRYENGRIMQDAQFVKLSFLYRRSPSGDSFLDRPLITGVQGKGDEGVSIGAHVVRIEDNNVFLLVISRGSGPSQGDLENELKAWQKGASRIVNESGVTILRLISFSDREFNEFYKKPIP